METQTNSASLIVDDGVHNIIQSAFAEGIVTGGSLLAIERGRILFDETFGHADLAPQRPFRAGDAVSLATLRSGRVNALLNKCGRRWHEL